MAGKPQNEEVQPSSIMLEISSAPFLPIKDRKWLSLKGLQEGSSREPSFNDRGLVDPPQFNLLERKDTWGIPSMRLRKHWDAPSLQ